MSLRAAHESDFAAEHGDLDELMKRHIQHEPCSKYALHMAVKNNHSAVVEYLIKKYNLTSNDSILLEFAAHNNNSEMFTMLHDTFELTITSNCIKSFISHNNLIMIVNILDICENKIKTLNKEWNIIDTAIFFNKYDIIVYLYKTYEFMFNQQCIDYAIECGSVDIVKFLINHMQQPYHISININMITSVVFNGYVEMIEYIYNMGKLPPYFITTNTMDLAVISNNTDMVKILYERFHIKPSHSVFRKAVTQNNTKMVKYLFEVCKIFNTSISIAVEKGYLDLVKYLYEICHDDVIDDDFTNAASKHRTSVLEYLYSVNEYGYSVHVMNIAVSKNYVDIVNLVIKNKLLFDKRYALKIAIENNYVEILDLLNV